jgi:hypothetical protein
MPQDAFGLASLYDPSIATDEAALQRQMALAQALRAQSLQGQGLTQMAGNVAIRNSPLEGVAKVVQALKANQLDSTTDASRQALSQKTMTAMAQLLRGDQPTAGQPVPNAQGSAPTVPVGDGAAQGAPAPGGMGLPQLLRGSVISSLGGPAMGSAYAKRFEPTDLERKLDAAGITDPMMRRQITQANLSKENYIPPANIRPGGYTQDPTTGQVQQYPQVPAGFQAVPNGQGGFSVVPVQGGTKAIAESNEAGAVGSARVTPQEVFNRTTGAPEIVSRAEALGYGQSGNVAPSTQTARDGERMKILMDERAKLAAEGRTDPALEREIALSQPKPQSGRFQSAPAVGQAAGAEAQQKALSTKWEALQSQNREAANTSSYLQNIVQAAEKGAVTGPNADRREMIQGMLQLAGINEKVNENATTQTQLLDKYHNQIVTRLGQGGLGTDAARSMLDSAYPGKAMNVDAIREAAGNLLGAQGMLQAKTRFVQEPGIKQDPAEYARREILFDQAADPRIWQWKNIQDPAAKKAFARSLMQQDPSLPQRIKALEQAGAL